jgi:hypothetical protein
LKETNFSFFIDENAPPPSPNPNEADGGLTQHLGESVVGNAMQTPWGFHHITNFLPSYDRDDGFFVYFDVNLNSEQVINNLLTPLECRLIPVNNLLTPLNSEQATNYLDFMEQGFFIGRNTDTIDVQVGLVKAVITIQQAPVLCLRAYLLYIIEYTTGTWKPLSDCVK